MPRRYRPVWPYERLQAWQLSHALVIESTD